MSCHDYQIAFEQRAAGASPGTDELDRHFTACAGCAAYASASRKLMNAMSNVLLSSPAPLDLATMHARIAQWRRQARWFFVALPFLVLPAVLLSQGIESSQPWFAIAGGMIGGLIVALGVGLVFRRRRLAQLASLERDLDGQMVAGWRAEIDRQIKDARFAQWFLPAITAIGVARDGGLDRGEWPSVIWMVLVPFVAAAVVVATIRRRRLERERALLAP